MTIFTRILDHNRIVRLGIPTGINRFMHIHFSLNKSYIQGQEPEPKIREYFYYIDHQGMLFLDDARMKNFTSCFKETRFLKFFFGHLRLNETNRYKEEFPYLSLCGREHNFVRCDDYPIVYTHVIQKESGLYLSHNHAGDLLIEKFEPGKMVMMPETGRLYHPAPKKFGAIGLVGHKLAMKFSKYLVFGNGEGNPPTRFTFDNVTYELDQTWYIGKITHSV